MNIQFAAGEGIHFSGPVNYLIDTEAIGGRYSIYAECLWPDGTQEDYGYITLKKAILDEMEKRNLKTDDFSFWYDGQEQFLSDDANADCEVYVDITID